MTSYSNVQKQQLSQLGAYLQEKRQEQGKSLEDISLQTYIRAKLIKAVENGDTSDLPQPIFVQGFIRRYADALGLDGTNFAKQFPVHSIPNTPRPNPRPATKIDIPTYQPAEQEPAVQPSQSPPYQPTAPTPIVQPSQPKLNQAKPQVGALPTQGKPTHAFLTGNGSTSAPAEIIPEKPKPENATPEVVPQKPKPENTAPEVVPQTSEPENTIPEVAPKKSEPEDAIPEVTSPSPDFFQLDPRPIDNSELAAMGLNDIDIMDNGSDNGADFGTDTVNTQEPSQSTSPYQRSPFASPADADTETPPPVSSPSPTPSAALATLPGKRSSSESSSLSGMGSTMPWLPWGIGAAVVVGAIALIAPRIIGNRQTPPPETTAPPTEVTQTEATPAPTEVPAVETTPEATSTPAAISNAPVNLQVEITEAGPSWMSVTVDGAIVFEGLLDPGAKELWEGQESISLNIGNAGAAMISSNGGDPVPAGNPGGAEFLLFTAEE